MYGYQFYHMQMAAKEHGWTPFSVMENHYNLIYREDERELIPIANKWMFPWCHTARWPQVIWQEQSGHLGLLGGERIRWLLGNMIVLKEQDVKIIKRVQELSERHHYTMAQIALAWQWAKGVFVSHYWSNESTLFRWRVCCAEGKAFPSGDWLSGR